MRRRNFLKSAGLASTALLAPDFLQALNFTRGSSTRSGKILVVVQLSGGNDGLNTIIPFQDDLYYNLRPRLGIAAKEVLKVSDSLGFNPAMDALRELYDEGQMCIINNVGYPNPDRSHFRSMDIWHTASDSNEYLSKGWIGSYLDHACDGCAPYHALEVNDSLSLAMKGELRSGFAMSEPNRLKKTTDNKFLKTIAQLGHEEEENVAYLYKTMIDTQSSADYLAQQSKLHRSKVQYPFNPFAKDLKQIAELITADSDIRIFYVSLTGFDTHANQRGKQERLLKMYAEGIKAFTEDLRQNGLFDDTLIMTFSEFGRRAKQNASNGTDHGTANNVFLMGGNLKKAGFYNNGPDLQSLRNNDLVYDIDFRRIYATILNGWLDADMGKILGKRFDPLGFV